MRKVRGAHISDMHFKDGPRAQEIAHVCTVAGEIASKEKVDFILCTGDVFDALSDPDERLMFADVLARWTHIAPVIIIKGNHDRGNDLALFERVGGGVHVEIASPVEVAIQKLYDTARGGHPVIVCESSRLVHVGDAVIYGLPWFNKSEIAAQVSAEQGNADDLGERLRACARSLLYAFQTFGAQTDEIPILGGHVLVGGSVVSTGQTLIGTTIELSPGDLQNANCAYVALGHVHKPQEWNGGAIAYAGSPWRQNYGEPETKGFRIFEIERRGTQFPKLTRSEFIELPARRVELLEVDLTKPSNRAKFNADPMAFLAPQLKQCNDAMVRLRYRISAEHLPSVDRDRLAATLKTTSGAFETKVEAVVAPTVRTRAPEVVEQAGMVDKWRVYAKAQGIDLTPERSLVIETLIDEFSLEGEDAAA